MNRQMPSKGCDPLEYNGWTKSVRTARRTVKKMKNVNPVGYQIAKVILILTKDSRDRVLNPEKSVFTSAGSIVGGKKEDWVLRA
ncbi:Hypothetical Protein OBI_RACECAR_266 [Arthrobacter phage Racecar]|nr:hypothetical protein PBI_RACECAR_58 [Arthrobacter phage Racecar]QFG12742.1 hypothetical protein PBI_MIMI_58 [Arthrobacter phage Mimi]